MPEATIPLGLALPQASSGLTRRYGSSKPRTSLFGLAPGRVCRAIFVTEDAVGSYPTVSPLPFISPKLDIKLCDVESTNTRHQVLLAMRKEINGGLFSVALSVTPSSRKDCLVVNQYLAL